MATSPFSIEIKQDWEGLVRCIRREGRPDRVYFIELLLDAEGVGGPDNKVVRVRRTRGLNQVVRVITVWSCGKDRFTTGKVTRTL